MAERLALRFVSRCQTVDQFARVFCQHAQPDRLSVPLAIEPPPVGTRLRATVALASKLGVIEGDAEIVDVHAGTVQLRFHALDPRSRGFLAHLVANRAGDPAPVPRHLVPMGAAVAAGPTAADPALGTCLVETLAGSGPVPQPVDINATTRTSAAPPVARPLPPVDPARALAARARVAPTVTGVPTLAPTPTSGRPTMRSAVPVPPSLDDGRTQPVPAPAHRRAADSQPIDDLATDIVPALPDAGGEADPTIEPPLPAPRGHAPGATPPRSAPALPPVQPAMAPPLAHGSVPPPPAPMPPPMAGYPPPPAPYGAPPPMAPPMSGYGAAPTPMPPPMAAAPPPPAPVLSPASVGNAVAGPASAASWPMPAPPPGWSPAPAPAPARPPQTSYPTAQLPALGYDGGGVRRPGAPRDRRRPVEMEGDPDLTEIVTVPRRATRASRRRWPVIAVTSFIVVVLVVIAIVASRTDDGAAPTGPGEPPATGTAGPPTTAPPAAAATPAVTPPAPEATTPPAPEATTPPAPEATTPPPAVAPAPAEPAAAAAAAPATGPCKVSFASSPDGATVLVDGAQLGTTPFTAEVPCAPFTASFRRDRYRTEKRAVEPRPGEQTVDVRLDRPTFKLEVVSRPPGASITVGGVAAGRTPATVSVPGYENVTIEVARPGYASQTRKVHASRTGERIDFTLRRKRR